MNTTEITNEKDIANLNWLRDVYFPSVDRNYTRAAAELQISHKVLKGLIDGTYDGNWKNQLEKLNEARAVIIARSPFEALRIKPVKTVMLMRVWAAAEAARAAQNVSIVIGKSQTGKTTAAEAYLEERPNTTIYIRMTKKPTISFVVAELADALGLGRVRTKDATMRTLRTKITSNHLIIVDEAHLALDCQKSANCLDIIRELFDRCHCGVLMLVTDFNADGSVLTKNDFFPDELSQLSRRAIYDMLPALPSKTDLRAIWTAYGLSDPDKETADKVYAMGRQFCFGEFCRRLRMAVVAVAARKEPLTWAAFNDALIPLSKRPANA